MQAGFRRPFRRGVSRERVGGGARRYRRFGADHPAASRRRGPLCCLRSLLWDFPRSRPCPDGQFGPLRLAPRRPANKQCGSPERLALTLCPHASPDFSQSRRCIGNPGSGKTAPRQRETANRADEGAAVSLEHSALFPNPSDGARFCSSSPHSLSSWRDRLCFEQIV